MGDLSRRPSDGGESSGDRPGIEEVAAEVWAAGEETANEVVVAVHPTLDSEEKRRDVIEYLQKLIRTALGHEAYPYGSVPLKTYLPDGDIDLTTLTSLTVGDSLPREVHAVLLGEQNNRYAEYVVKEVQFIDAEVKLVKCLVDNIVIDLSFNQLGGLRTLCFLEQVDRCVGKNHLFKRSIILVKTWCYYESRILGAHHGLISTYGLETLVLYIFNLFHASLNGPLAALYKFLDYFSKFDWENYCISLYGPVRKSSLPDVIVDMAQSKQTVFLLDNKFLNNCIDMYSAPFMDADGKVFPEKFLNIIDPLKENNNLGRSVNKGSYYRIGSALKYGARTLGQVLKLPRERIADGVKNFFANTLKRHGRDGTNFTTASFSRSLPEEEIQINPLSLYSETNSGGDFDYKSPSMDFITGELSLLNELKIAQSDLMGKQINNYIQPGSVDYFHSDNYDYFSKFSPGIMSPDGSISEDLAFDLREKDLIDIVGSLENSNPLSDLTGDYDSNMRSLLYGQLCHSRPSSNPPMQSVSPNFAPSDPPMQSLSPNFAPSAPPTQSLSPNFAPSVPPTQSLSPNFAPSAPLMQSLSSNFAPQYVSQNPWNNTAHQSTSMNYCSSSHFMDNRMNMGWSSCPPYIPGPPNPVFYVEERMDKPRGTGTYLPNGCASRERPSRGRGRNYGPGNYRQYNRPRSGPILPYKKSSEKGVTIREQIPEDPSPDLTHEKTEVAQESNTSSFDESQDSNFILGLQKLEFGSLGNLSDGSSSVRASETSSGWDSITGKLKSAEPLFDSNHEMVEKQTYFLKDEDFPPLAV